MRRSDVLMWRAMIRRVTSESGFTLVEMLVAVAASSLLLLGIGNFLVSAMNSQVFTSSESATVNETRNAMQQIEKEIRGANSISWTCGSATGNCLQMDAQKAADGPAPNTRTVKYVYASSALTRQVFDSNTSTWGAAQVIISRVANITTAGTQFQ